MLDLMDIGIIKGLSLSRLTLEDQLMVRALRAFRFNHNLTRLEQIEPQAHHALRGFHLIIRYLRGTLPFPQLRPLLKVLSRLGDRYSFLLGVSVRQVSQKTLTIQDPDDFTCPLTGDKPPQAEPWVLKWLHEVEDNVALRLLNQIWCDARAIRFARSWTEWNKSPPEPAPEANPELAEFEPPEGRIFSILTDQPPRCKEGAWTEPKSFDILERILVTREEAYKDVQHQWSITVEDYKISICQGVITDIWHKSEVYYDLSDGTASRRLSPIRTLTPAMLLPTCLTQWDTSQKDGEEQCLCDHFNQLSVNDPEQAKGPKADVATKVVIERKKKEFTDSSGVTRVLTPHRVVIHSLKSPDARGRP